MHLNVSNNARDYLQSIIHDSLVKYKMYKMSRIMLRLSFSSTELFLLSDIFRVVNDLKKKKKKLGDF